MSLEIYNTLANAKEVFKPIIDGRVGLYVCGMTVYDLCHLGHARVMISFDMICRYLKFKGYDVHYVRNITDIDDKILDRAQRDDVDFKSLVQDMIREMHFDFNQLNLLTPNEEPRVTEHMFEIVQLINRLITNGYAYVGKNDDVYFRVRKFDGYGKLSGRNIDDLDSGSRVEVDLNKEDPLDFVLWKSVKDGSPSSPSPWGVGRPGWHIECSAMSMKSLGETYDIHGGGPDLKFPHHENEIAQSESATGKPYANHWIHAGPLLVDGKKMSKSLNNFVTIRDVLEEYDPEVLRMFILSSHYRSGVDYSQSSIDDAKLKLGKLYNSLRHDVSRVNPYKLGDPIIDSFYNQFIKAMDDDFNTPLALSVLFELAGHIEKVDDKSSSVSLLRDLLIVLGFKAKDIQFFFKSHIGVYEIEEIILERNQYKLDKDYAKADEIRVNLEKMNIKLKDGRDGTSWEYMY